MRRITLALLLAGCMGSSVQKVKLEIAAKPGFAIWVGPVRWTRTYAFATQYGTTFDNQDLKTIHESIVRSLADTGAFREVSAGARPGPRCLELDVGVKDAGVSGFRGGIKADLRILENGRLQREKRVDVEASQALDVVSLVKNALVEKLVKEVAAFLDETR
jgi:hypothetical protein